MKRVEKSVFLSYRRTNLPWALAVFQNLRQHGYDVFFDYNGIASGDFEQVILGHIRASAHFVVVLTPSALKRCDDPADWLRREVETALANQRNIVPLMLEGFNFGTPKIASQLTGNLAALKHYNGLIIPPEYFDEAMERLRSRYLSVPLAAVLHPASFAAQEAASLQRTAADAAPAVQKKELTAQQWFEQGFAASDIDEKLRFYSEAIRLEPDNALAFIDRGNARDDKGDLDGAIKDFNDAIRLEPDSADAFIFRGNARHAKGDLDGAIKDYSEAIRLKPDYTDYADPFFFRGNARRAKGDLDGSIEDYSEAIRLKPDYTHVYTHVFVGRGYSRLFKGDLDGALKDFSEAIRVKMDNTDAFIGRGHTRYAKGDLDTALKDFSKAIRLKPDRADAFVGRGDVRHGKGDLDGAIKDYNEAIRLEPDYADAFNSRGGARRDKGDLEEAAKDFRKATLLKAGSDDEVSTNDPFSR